MPIPGVVAYGTVQLVGSVAPSLGGYVGFGTLGPTAGSIAATAQAYVGNVAAGSAFSTCQSAAMGGAASAGSAAATVATVVVPVAVVAAAGYGAYKFAQSDLGQQVISGGGVMAKAALSASSTTLLPKGFPSSAVGCIANASSISGGCIAIPAVSGFAVSKM